MIQNIIALFLLSTQDTLCGMVISLNQIERYKSQVLLLKLIMYFLKRTATQYRTLLFQSEQCHFLHSVQNYIFGSTRNLSRGVVSGNSKLKLKRCFKRKKNRLCFQRKILTYWLEIYLCRWVVDWLLTSVLSCPIDNISYSITLQDMGSRMFRRTTAITCIVTACKETFEIIMNNGSFN